MRKLKDEIRDPLKELPFQLQITYTTPDGAKAIRVYTKVQEFTKERHEAEANLQSQDIIWGNAAQKMSYHALSSNVKASKLKQAQISKYRARNNWKSPVELQQEEEIIQNLGDEQRAESLGDSEANNLFKLKKINRNKFT